MSARARSDLALTGKIEAIHRRSRDTYGSPNIHAELADDHGIRVGRKRVARLMRAAGFKGATLRRFVVTTQPDPKAEPAIDLVERQFYADGPDRLWVADITYIPTWAGFLYLAMVLDVFSRQDRRLGDGDAPADGADPRGTGHGDHAAPTVGGDPPFGPRLPVHQLRVRQALPGSRCHALHGIGRRCVRQRDGGELLRDASSASCSAGGGSRARRRRRWRCLNGSKVGTTRIVVTPRSATDLRSTTSAHIGGPRKEPRASAAFGGRPRLAV